MVILYLLALVFAYYYSDFIYHFISRPLINAMGGKGDFIYTGLAEAFFTKLNLSAKVAFLIVIPLVAFHAYRFVEPGLYKREKPLILISIIASPVLFFSGFFFVFYFVMPKAFEFFVSFQVNSPDYSIHLQAKISEYVDLISSLVVAFGISFQLPVFLIILISLNIISTSFLKEYRRYAILFIFILAGIITPPDVLSQLLLAFPLVALYEITIIIARQIETKRPQEARNA